MSALAFAPSAAFAAAWFGAAAWPGGEALAFSEGHLAALLLCGTCFAASAACYLSAAFKARSLGPVLALPSLPIYWLLISLAAWRALYEFLAAPHFWHKTEHGLARRREPPSAICRAPKTG